MKHFSSGAYYASKWYLPGHVILNKGRQIEYEQYGSSKKSMQDSAFSYEDLPSNLLGIFFGEDYSNSGSYKSKTSVKLNDFQKELISFLVDLEVVENPLDEAPNIQNVPEYAGERNKKIPTQQNRRSRPMFTTESLKLSDGHLDFEILSLAEDLRPYRGYYYNIPIEGGGYIIGENGRSEYHPPGGGAFVPE